MFSREFNEREKPLPGIVSEGNYILAEGEDIEADDVRCLLLFDKIA